MGMLVSQKCIILVLMIYSFVEYDPEDNYEDQEAGLKSLLTECEYIVTNYSTMYPAEGCTVRGGLRGPTLYNEDGFDWYYSIKGGYSR